jgi:hypothetical protein
MAVACAVAGCTSTTYCIQRAALVPISSPSQRPAALATGPIEGALGLDTVLWAAAPRAREDRNVGLYVPRVQLQGNLLFSWNRYVSLGLAWEAGVADGSVAISENNIAAPGESIGGIGPHVSFHFPLGRQFVLDLGCEVKGYSVASRIQYTECGPPDEDGIDSSGERQTSDTVILPRAWIAVSGDLRWSTITMGFGIRPQVYNTDETIEAHASSASIDTELEYEIYPYLYVGWEFHIRQVAHVSLGVYQPVMFDPVMYAPVVGVNVRLTYASRSRRFNDPGPRGWLARDE